VTERDAVKPPPDPGLLLFAGIVGQIVGAVMLFAGEDLVQAAGYVVWAVGGLATFVGATAVAVSMGIRAARRGDA